MVRIKYDVRTEGGDGVMVLTQIVEGGASYINRNTYIYICIYIYMYTHTIIYIFVGYPLGILGPLRLS